MIPEFPYLGSPTLPAAFAGWTPRPSDIGEEGFSYFRDTWYLGRVSVKDARRVVELEAHLLDVVDAISSDGATFDELAAAIEFGNLDEAPFECRTHPQWVRLEEVVVPEQSTLGGLELGVGGLAVTLASIAGCFPAASCRAHSASISWAPHPVVLLACDGFRADRLVEFLAPQGCGLDVDPARPELLAVGAGSVRSLNRLAQSLLAAHRTFRKPRANTGSQRRVREPNGEHLQRRFDLG